jgi:hypothetical protein
MKKSTLRLLKVDLNAAMDVVTMAATNWQPLALGRVAKMHRIAPLIVVLELQALA